MDTRLKSFYIFKGKKAGPVSMINIATHGNEPCGYKALQQLLSKKFKIDSGTLIVTIANVNALATNSRKEHQDLNRMFGRNVAEGKRASNEYAIAQYLQTLVCEYGVTAVLDVHSTDTMNDPFVFSERNANDIVMRFPKDFNRLVYGIDKIHPGSFDGWMYRNGLIGICAECGYHFSQKSVNFAKAAMMSFLLARGHISGKKPRKSKRTFVQVKKSYKAKFKNFKLNNSFEDFEMVTKGTLVGVDGGETVVFPINGIILFADGCDDVGEDAFIYCEEVLE
jgi:predicted deacylase